MEDGNFHLIFTRRCPRTFCPTLRYHAIFEGTIEEAFQPLLGRLILHPSRNSGRSDLSVRTSARYPAGPVWLLPRRSLLLIYRPILLLPHGALRNYAHPSLFLPPPPPAMLFSRGRGLIRTLIRDDLSGLDRHGRWTRATHDRPQSRPPLFPPPAAYSRQSI